MENSEGPGSAPPAIDWTKAAEAYHDRAVTTQNPVYPWLALEAALLAAGGQTEDLADKDRVSIPGWLAEYLLGCAERLKQLSACIEFRVEPSTESLPGDTVFTEKTTLQEMLDSPQAKRSLAQQKVAPTRAMELIPAALGLTRPGWNAFASFGSMIERVQEFRAYEYMLAQGMTGKEAREVIFRDSHLRDERRQQERVAEGRELAGDQTRKPGG